MKKETLLLICPDFYDYPGYLNKAFSEKYYVITVPVRYTDVNILSKKRIGIKKLFTKNYRKNWLMERSAELSKLIVDKVLIISLFPFSNNLLDILKQNNPNIEVYIFLWDELDKIPQICNIFKYANEILSFNSLDLPKLLKLSKLSPDKCKYLPNFYIARSSANAMCKYAIGYIGTVNPDTLDRLAVVDKLWKWCKLHDVRGNFYLRYHDYWHGASIWKKIFIRLFRKEYFNYIKYITSKYGDRPYLNNRILSVEEVLEFEECTDCIVDISHSNRQGYTLNAISALGNNRKLLTTNLYIIKEPFFGTDKISILDDKMENLNVKFFKNKNIEKNIGLECLEINNWIRMIFEQDYYNENIDLIYRKDENNNRLCFNQRI